MTEPADTPAPPMTEPDQPACGEPVARRDDTLITCYLPAGHAGDHLGQVPGRPERIHSRHAGAGEERCGWNRPSNDYQPDRNAPCYLRAGHSGRHEGRDRRTGDVVISQTLRG